MVRKFLLTGIIIMFIISLSGMQVEVGTHDGSSYYVPVNGLWDYNWSRSVYLQSELVQAMEMTGIGYYITNEPADYSMDNQKIYLKHTANSSITSTEYIDPTTDDSYQLVYNGSITYNGTGWQHIEFDTDFNYNGTDNLEIISINNDGSGASGYPLFAKSPTPGAARSSYKHARNTFPAQAGTVVQYHPWTQFIFNAPGAPAAAVLTSPTNGALDTLLPVTLEWAGGEATDIFSIYLSEDYSSVGGEESSALLQENITTNSLIVENLEELTTYYWKVLSSNTVSEYVVPSEIFSFKTHAGEGLVVVGHGTLENQGLPMEPYWDYTISQTIYLQDWINVDDQRIESISYYTNGNNAWTEDNIQIFMAHTDDEYFSTRNSWMLQEELLLVYDGPFIVPATESWVEIELDVPFNYNNSQNLLVAFAANSSGSFSNSDDFHCSLGTASQSLEMHSNSVNYNFVSPPAGTLRNTYPNTLFSFGDIPTTPQIAIVPESYNWSSTFVGTSATPATFTITNSGSGILTISSVSLVGDSAFTLDDDNTYPLELSDNSAQFVVNFTPVASGEFVASITVADSEGNETTIPISGTGYDSTISEFPHFEGFEETPINSLPEDWSELVVSSAAAYSHVTASDPYQGSNSLKLYNSFDANPEHLKVVTAPVQDIFNKKIIFYARASSTGISLGVGTTSSGTEAEAYNEIINLPLTTDYQQFELDLFSAEDDDSRICFSYSGNGANYNLISLDNLLIEEMPQLPFAEIVSRTMDFGNIHVNRVGEASFTIRNRGLENLIANLSSTNTHITFPENQINISPATEQECLVNLQPTLEGYFSGSFNVATNASNAQYITMSVTARVHPFLPEDALVIGYGELVNQGLPLDPYHHHTYSQTIYYTSELNITNQRVERIGWRYNGNSAWGPEALKIYMGVTQQTEFASHTSWINSADMEEVYEGTISVTLNEGFIDIPLDSPFFYDGTQNLVIGVSYSGSSTHGYNDGFFCTEGDSNRSIAYFGDSTIPDPTTPPSASSLNSSYPNVKLQFGEVPVGAAIAVVQHNIDFGDVYLSRTGRALLDVRNIGIANLNANLTATGTELTFAPESAVIEPSSFEQFTVHLDPEAEGTYTGSFVVNSNDINRPEVTVTTTANILPAIPDGLVIIGTGDLVEERLPMDIYSRHSYSQTIYYADEIEFINQRIDKIMWHFNGFYAWGPEELRIFMGFTDETQFDSNTSWISVLDMVEVYNGYFSVPATDGYVETILDIPFNYDEPRNLVISVFKSGSEYYDYENSFYCTEAPNSRSIVYHSDSTVPNPYAPPTQGDLKYAYPNVKLQLSEIPNVPDLALYPADVIYEVVPVNSVSAEKTVTIRSTGMQEITVSSAPVITGAVADQFMITTDNNIYPLVLALGETATVGVTFHPTSAGSKHANLEITGRNGDRRQVFSNNLIGYGLGVDGNDHPTHATVLTLPVEGDLYAIMPAADVDWYKIPAMGIGDTLKISSRAIINDDIKGWLYGPVTDPATIAGSQPIASGKNIAHLLPESGDYYLRVAHNLFAPSPESIRESFAGNNSRPDRDNTGLYRLYVNAYYNYDYNTPINLEARNSSGFVELSWIEPEYERYLVGYKIYRNGEQVNSELIPIGTNRYNDADVFVGTEYTYHVVGVYEDPDGQSLPSNSVTIIYFNEGEPIWGDGFEDHPDFTIELDNWIQYDIDGASTYGISNVEFENAGEPMSYIVFNPSATTPPLTDMSPYEGDKFLASFASSAGTNNDWIITPSFTIGNQTVLSFYAKSFSSEFQAERFRVKMSLGGSEVDDFQYILHQGVSYLEAPTEWTPYYFNLSSLAGSTARFAIQCISENAFVFMVDNFRIDGTDDTVDNQDNNIVPVSTNLAQNYPNPFNPETTISFSTKESGLVSLDIYNIRGQKVRTLLNDHKDAGSHNVVWNGKDDNGKSVASGVFFYRMKSEKYSSTKKMILMK